MLAAESMQPWTAYVHEPWTLALLLELSAPVAMQPVTRGMHDEVAVGLPAVADAR